VVWVTAVEGSGAATSIDTSVPFRAGQPPRALGRDLARYTRCDPGPCRGRSGRRRCHRV